MIDVVSRCAGQFICDTFEMSNGREAGKPERQFRLRSIPKQAIVRYSIEPWALMRGYGIRGVGSTRAYVWGNKVVHITTTNGEVFLGHSDPERIIRDLDRVTGFVTRG